MSGLPMYSPTVALAACTRNVWFCEMLITFSWGTALTTSRPRASTTPIWLRIGSCLN